MLYICILSHIVISLSVVASVFVRRQCFKHLNIQTNNRPIEAETCSVLKSLKILLVTSVENTIKCLKHWRRTKMQATSESEIYEYVIMCYLQNVPLGHSPHGTLWIRGWAGPRADVDVAGE
jgi:hypothetical protein